jgi:hypothetical protein
MRRFNPEWLNRPRKRDNPENHLVLQIIHYLRTCGLTCGKIKTQGSPKVGGGFLFDPYRITGLPDILASDRRNGKNILYALECKIGKNKQSPNQQNFQEIFHYPPSRQYLVIYSLEEIQEIIK